MNEHNTTLHNQGVHPSVARPAQAVDIGQLCETCAREGHSCCNGHDIYVTWGDCIRIHTYLHQTAFFEYRRTADPDYVDQSDDPIWQRCVFRTDGSRRVLRRDHDGNCLFLTSKGCCLPLTVRPLVCRLYPHTYTSDGIRPQWDGSCLAALQADAGKLEQGIAGIEPQTAANWHRQLYDEILLEGSGQ